MLHAFPSLHLTLLLGFLLKLYRFKCITAFGVHVQYVLWCWCATVCVCGGRLFKGNIRDKQTHLQKFQKAQPWLPGLDWVCPCVFVYVTKISITAILPQEKWQKKKRKENTLDWAEDKKNLAHAPTQHIGAYYFTYIYIYKFHHGFPWPLQWRDLFKSCQSGLVAMEVMGAGNKAP